jgi:hypothetical protein
MTWPVKTATIPVSCRALEYDEVVRELVAARVNISQAAKALGVPSPDLRRLMVCVPQLLDLAIEEDEKRIDKAMRNLDEMLDGEDKLSKKEASFFVLKQSKRAAQRGWRQPDAEVTINNNISNETRVVSLTWGNGQVIGKLEYPAHMLPPERVIERDPVEHARIDAELRQIAEEREAEEERRRQGDHDSG